MIWDRTTRIVHWIVALSVVLNLFILDEHGDPHLAIGYIAMSFVVYRGIWGFFGSKHSRFKAFPMSPKEILDFSTTFFSKYPKDYTGHNPLASIVYILIWLLIIALGITGWMMGIDKYWGEEWVENLHSRFSDGLLALTLIHFLGMTIDSIRHRRKTWMKMIRGR